MSDNRIRPSPNIQTNLVTDSLTPAAFRVLIMFILSPPSRFGPPAPPRLTCLSHPGPEGRTPCRHGTGPDPLFADPAPPALALAERRARRPVDRAEHRTLRVPAEIRAHARPVATLAASGRARLCGARLRQPSRPVAAVPTDRRIPHPLHRQPEHDGDPALPRDSGGDGAAGVGVHVAWDL